MIEPTYVSTSVFIAKLYSCNADIIYVDTLTSTLPHGYIDTYIYVHSFSMRQYVHIRTFDHFNGMCESILLATAWHYSYIYLHTLYIAILSYIYTYSICRCMFVNLFVS